MKGIYRRAKQYYEEVISAGINNKKKKKKNIKKIYLSTFKLLMPHDHFPLSQITSLIIY
jgi:hypothetical protein